MLEQRDGRTPSERELAEHFGVSRGQIREALAILEAMRIVERRAKSGIYLDHAQASVEAMALFAKAGVPLDPIQIYETVELRKIHEIKAAELACTPSDGGEFRAAARDPARIGGAARRAARASRGRTATSTSRSCARPRTASSTRSAASTMCMGEQRLPIYFSDPERGRRSHAEHLQIFDALLRRDGNLAQALMSAHLQGAESYWKGLIGGDGSRQRRTQTLRRQA